MPLFVGHDLGTGGNKASLVDLEGRVLAEHTATYPLAHPEKGWAEQEPEHWWRAVVECTRSVVSKAGVSPSDVVGLGFAGQMLSLVPLDREGTIKVPVPQVGITVLAVDGDPVDIAATARRVVHAKVSSQRAL